MTIKTPKIKATLIVHEEQLELRTAGKPALAIPMDVSEFIGRDNVSSKFDIQYFLDLGVKRVEEAQRKEKAKK